MAENAAVGIAEHLGWAWLVSVGIAENRPILLDSRRVDLVAPDLPCMPFHHDTDGMELSAADEVLAKVSASAAECARTALKSAKEAVAPARSLIVLAIREPPLGELPRSVEASRDSYHINCRADGMLYHQAICAAAEELNLTICFHRRRQEEARAAEKLGTSVSRLGAVLATMGEGQRSWTKEHRHAAAAAIAALYEHA